MKRIGICTKCGEEKIVRDHHIRGYKEEHKDEVVPYCESCDRKAHAKARREGRCTLPSKETNRLSMNSCFRRTKKVMALSSDMLEPNISLREQLHYNIKTGNVTLYSYFIGEHGKKLKVIEE